MEEACFNVACRPVVCTLSSQPLIISYCLHCRVFSFLFGTLKHAPNKSSARFWCFGGHQRKLVSTSSGWLLLVSVCSRASAINHVEFKFEVGSLDLTKLQILGVSRGGATISFYGTSLVLLWCRCAVGAHTWRISTAVKETS